LKRCVIHVGLHKTGTTSIQHYCWSNRESLLQQGVAYPDIDGNPNHSRSMYSLFCPRPWMYYLNRLQGIETQEQAEAHNAGLRERLLQLFQENRSEVFLFSGEDMSNLNRPAGRKMHAFLEPHFEDFAILAYMREPVSCLSSIFAQHVSDGRTMDEVLDRFRNRIHTCLNYAQRVAPFLLAFGRQNVTIRSYDPGRFHQGSLVADFFQAMGRELPPQAEAAQPRANTSLCATALQVFDRINRVEPMYVDGKPNMRRFGSKSLLRNTLGRLEGEKYVIPSEVIRSNEQYIKGQLAWLEKFLDKGSQLQVDEDLLGRGAALQDAMAREDPDVARLAGLLLKAVRRTPHSRRHLDKACDLIEAMNARREGRPTDATAAAPGLARAFGRLKNMLG